MAGKTSTWSSLSKEELQQRLAVATHMLYKIASNKEVWSIYEVKKVIKTIIAGRNRDISI